MMRISPEQVGSAARTIEDCAAQLRTGLGDLEATVTAQNPWGTDEPGTLFGVAYLAVANHAIETYDSHAGQLQYAADGLVSMAARLVRSDQDAAQRVNQAGEASRWG